MPAGSIAADPPVKGASPATREYEAGKDPDRWRRYATGIGFLAPALVFLGIWVVYPTIYTIIRSFCDRAGTSCVGIDNYKALFTTSVLLTTIKNTAIWVLVVPALVTAIGLVFTVLTERVRWSVAFKTAVFMPMAISLFAAGVIWHSLYQQDPSQGRHQRRGARGQGRHKPARRALRRDAFHEHPAGVAEEGLHHAPGAALQPSGAARSHRHPRQ